MKYVIRIMYLKYNYEKQRKCCYRYLNYPTEEQKYINNSNKIKNKMNKIVKINY